NIFPRLFVDFYEAAASGDAQRLAEVRAKVQALQAIYDIGKYASRYIKATKCALSLEGICDDCMAEPFDRFHAPERERVREILRALPS
ncbi:MAG: dihydrodipicolinate synthase family protein, partial [Aureliella sp.]